MRASVVLAVAGSACGASGVMVILVAVVAQWRRRRRWNRELDQEFPPGS